MPKKILIIDDDLMLAKLMRRRFITAGYEVLVVPDAILGNQEAHQFKPDIIILDMMLPGGGGLSVLKGLESSVYTAAIPVLVITGLQRDCHEGYFKEISQFQVEGCLEKPFDGAKLLAEVERVLEEHSPKSAA